MSLSTILSVVGLGSDIVGFVLVFTFGGFTVGEKHRVVIGEGTIPNGRLRAFRWTGFTFVVAGFVLQIVGALLRA